MSDVVFAMSMGQLSSQMTNVSSGENTSNVTAGKEAIMTCKGNGVQDDGDLLVVLPSTLAFSMGRTHPVVART